MAKKKSTSEASRKAKKSTKKAAKSRKGSAKTSAGKKTSARKATKRSTKSTSSSRKKAKKGGKSTKKAANKSRAKGTKTSAKTPNVPDKPKAAEASPLTKAQLRELRDLLLEKRRTLLGDMDGMQESNGGWQNGTAASMPTHPADVGTDNYEHEFTLGLLESERALLEEIDEALERMDNGTYGVCQGTGQPIGYPRLRARPWAKYCIDYARKIEKGLVRPGEGEGESPA